VQAIRIEDGAGFGPEDVEEAPDLGEEAGGGRGALCRRADGFPWRLGYRVGREEEGEDDQGEEGSEETLGELGHCDLLGPHGSGHYDWRGRASKRKGAAGRLKAGAQRLARARGLHVEVDAFLPTWEELGWPGGEHRSPAPQRAGACARRRICPSVDGGV
jgi:hypothetical protein